MRIVSLLVVVLSFSVLWAQEAKKDNPSQEQAKILAAMAEAEAALKPWRANAPSTLAEAFMPSLRISFFIGAILSVIAAILSAMRGERYIHGMQAEASKKQEAPLLAEGKPDTKGKIL